jgi:hypothetical protein
VSTSKLIHGIGSVGSLPLPALTLLHCTNISDLSAGALNNGQGNSGNQNAGQGNSGDGNSGQGSAGRQTGPTYVQLNHMKQFLRLLFAPTRHCPLVINLFPGWRLAGASNYGAGNSGEHLTSLEA